MIKSIIVRTEQELEVPTIPIFLKKGKETVKIEDIPKDELIRIASAWKDNLLKKAGFNS